MSFMKPFLQMTLSL